MLEFPRLAVYANLTPLFCLVILLIMIIYNPTYNKKQTRLFQIAAMVNMIMLLVISLDYVFAIAETTQWVPVRRITSFLNFSLSPVVPILLYKIFRPERSNKAIYIPIILNACLSFISIFNGIIFQINDTNGYERGLLFFLPFSTSVIYLIFLIVQREYRYKHNKQIERLFLLFSVVCLSFGMVLEIGFHYNFLTWDLSSICLFAYYLLLCIHNAILDPLTGAYNRIHYNKILSLYEHQKKFSIAMIDLNDFKVVNDTFGHEAGDQVLIQFTNLLEKHLNSISTICRIGGDEFVAISKKDNLEVFEELLETAREDANVNNMDFAYGLSVCTVDDNVSDILEQVDQRMYEHKKQCKQISQQ